jgi:Transposase IS116/IS110/IS902 family
LAPHRLDEITGCGPYAAQAVIAETGLDMTVFGAPGRLVSWAKLCPQTRQSGKKTSHGKAGKGNPWLGGILGEIAATAARTDTFLGQRYRRIARRRGKRKAQVAIARSILIIIYHLLADPAARYRDLGPDHYDVRVNRDRKIRSLIHQLQGHQRRPRRDHRAPDHAPARRPARLTRLTLAGDAPRRRPLPPARQTPYFPVRVRHGRAYLCSAWHAHSWFSPSGPVSAAIAAHLAYMQREATSNQVG